MVSDLDTGVVLDLHDERKVSSLDAYFTSLSAEERAQIEAVAMDMWEPYILSVGANLDEADKKIVFDRFHVAKHMGDAVNDVRKAEHRALLAAGDPTLTGTKYVWQYAEENLPAIHRATLRALKDTTPRPPGPGA